MLKNKIQKLIDLIENTDIEEIEISSFWGAQKIRLSKAQDNRNISSPSVSDKKVERKSISIEDLKESIKVDDVRNDIAEVNRDDDSTDISTEDNYDDETQFKIITAPLVGTFYTSPKPEDPPFVNIGDNIETGMVVCIVEAMKIFNDIESESSGELVHIYVESGTPVEYGQELFVLRINNV